MSTLGNAITRALERRKATEQSNPPADDQQKIEAAKKAKVVLGYGTKKEDENMTGG